MNGAKLCAFAASVVAVAVAAPSASPSDARDDTAWLQAKLDAGGTLFLPTLPDGGCYRTRGLWVSVDDTKIVSDGACIVALGPGATRLTTGPGTGVAADAVFLVDHSSVFERVPVRVTIRGMRITVPEAARVSGITTLGDETTVDSVTIDGEPTSDVVVGYGASGAGGITARTAITGSTLSGGRRSAITASGPVRLDVVGNTISGARTRGAAGVQIRSADRGQPVLDVRVAGNTIVDNAGAGIVVDLAPDNGPPVVASRIEIVGNRVSRNAWSAPVARRAGVVVAGGQADGAGELLVTDNVLSGNRGPALLGRDLLLRVTSERNDLSGNTGGETRDFVTVAAPARPAAPPWIAPFAAHTGDDTAWLQKRMDAGGTIFLPKLPGGACYPTRGLWVSNDDTTITSDGGCIVSLGEGEVRLRSSDGDPIASSAVFFVNRSSPRDPAPVGVTISNLRIVVPEGQGEMSGVGVYGHHVTLSNLVIEGAPFDDVSIGGRANGNGYAADTAVLASTLRGAKRNGVSAVGVIGLRIEGSTIADVRDSPPGQPAAGIDVEPSSRSQPTLDVRIVGNTIVDNAGPGILFELEENRGPGVLASGLVVAGNTILRNGRKPTPPKRAGVIVKGGEDGAGGTLLLADNAIRDNGGAGLLWIRPRLVVRASGNDLTGNDGGATAAG